MSDFPAMITSDVPTAVFIGRRASTTSAGTIRNPPPAPTSPVSAPTTTPSATTARRNVPVERGGVYVLPRRVTSDHGDRCEDHQKCEEHHDAGIPRHGDVADPEQCGGKRRHQIQSRKKDGDDRRHAKSDGHIHPYVAPTEVPHGADQGRQSHDKQRVRGRRKRRNPDDVYEDRYGKDRTATTNQPEGRPDHDRKKISRNVE